MQAFALQPLAGPVAQSLALDRALLEARFSRGMCIIGLAAYFAACMRDRVCPKWPVDVMLIWLLRKHCVLI